MINRQPTMLEVLYPKRFRRNAKRDQATRRVVQPRDDDADQSEAEDAAPSVHEGRKGFEIGARVENRQEDPTASALAGYRR